MESAMSDFFNQVDKAMNEMIAKTKKMIESDENSVNSYKISGNLIDTFPKEIVGYTNLDKLEITNTNIKTIPSSIGNLTRLKELNLSNNQINSLPESLGNLDSLKFLNIERNPIKKLPANLCKRWRQGEIKVKSKIGYNSLCGNRS